jgi:competence protein ComGC
MNGTPPPVSGGQPKTSGLAIWALVLGILAIVLTFICIGPILAIPAIICGHLASARINRSGGQLAGKGLAIAGFVTGYVSLALILLLLPIAIPNFIKARNTAQNNACISNLRQIDGAKQQWALENQKDASATPTTADLDKYMKHGFARFTCAKGGNYKINSVGESPTCTIEGHTLQ